MNINKTDEALDFIAHDCFETIQHNPYGPKTVEYYEYGKACLTELSRRAILRATRAALKLNMFDRLGLLPINKKVITLNGGAYFSEPSNIEKDLFLNACFDLGVRELTKRLK